MCRMHGGAKGSGAPSGRQNGNFKTGTYTKEGLALVRHHVGQGVEENTPIRHSCDITRFDQGMAMEIEKSDYSGLSLIWHLAFLPD